jgi:hypothetical protein
MFSLSPTSIETWIYVTGMIRSGTTFAGKILSHPTSTDYIHEPFNPDCGMEGVTTKYRYLRPELDTREMREYHDLASRVFSYDFRLRALDDPSDPWSKRLLKRLVGSRGPFYLRLAKLNPFHRAAVIKDPTGLLLTEYLFEHFGIRPVILVRHPVSVVASLERVNWWPGVDEINDQPALVSDYFSDELDFIYGEWSDPALRAAAYWRAVNKVLLTQASQHSSWIVLTHEELSQHPRHHFRSLYTTLGLPWSASVEKTIHSLTRNNGTPEARNGAVQDFRRNSSDIFELRRNAVPIETRRAIFELTKDVALQLYDRESFALDASLPAS